MILKKLALIIAISGILFASCKKASDIISPEKDAVGAMVSSFTKGKIPTEYDLVISLDRNEGTSGGGNNFGFWGNLNKPNTGKISINDISIDFNLAKKSYSLNSGTDSVLLKGKENLYFGRNNTITANNRTQALYTPAVVEPTFSNLQQDNSFSQRAGITVTWVVDRGNTTNKIGIAIEFSPITWNNSELFPDQPLMAKSYIVDERAGSFTIPAIDLVDFPSGCMPIIHIGRGNEQITDAQEISAEPTSYLAYTITHCFGRLLK